MSAVGRDFSRRSAETELMDEEAVSLPDFQACLNDLETVNTLTLARPPTLAWLNRAVESRAGGSISVLDVGFGHGDTLRRVHRWAQKRGIHAELEGIDLNPWSAIVARKVTPSDMRIAYHTADVFAFEPKQPFDFVISSLFTHHLSDEGIIRFLQWMERVGVRGWFVNDLHRHPIPFHVFRLVARIAGWHRFVQHDGPVSIARSFRQEDWRRLVETAGLDRSAVEIRWHMPFRLCVGRLK